MDIEDLHPLKSRAKFEHILPSCSFLRKCFKKKPDFKHSLRKTLLAQMKIKMPKSENTLMEDPFLILGYGVNAYFDIMISLAILCFIVTLFMTPVMMMYSGNDIKGLQSQPKYAFNQLTMGNLGGSSTLCAQKALETEKLTLSCPSGEMIISSNTKFGLMSKQVNQKIHCTEDSINAAEDMTKITNCSTTANFRRDTFKQALLSKCHLKKSCQIDLGNTFPYSPVGVSSNCQDQSFVYVQASCQIPNTLQSQRFIMGLFIGCMAVFIYLYSMVYFDYIKVVQTNLYVDWDVKTITAGDYTVEFDLGEDTYDFWKNHYYDDSNPLPENAQFKVFIQNELEERCTDMPHQGYEDEIPGEKYQVKISQITMAFNNAYIVNQLSKRGTLIKTEKWDKVAELNQEILEKLQNRENPEVNKQGDEEFFLDKVQEPVSVFATFDSEEGYQRAKNWTIVPQRQFCTQDLDIQEASEPTDIIWENRYFTPAQRSFKRVIVYCIILFMLTISGAIIFTCTNISLKLKFKYPIVDCNLIDADFGPSKDSKTMS